MYKSIKNNLKKITLDRNLYRIHKEMSGPGSFGMDGTPELFEGKFGLYSTQGTIKNIGPLKTEYFRISLARKGKAIFNIGLEKYEPRRNFILFGIPGQVFSFQDISRDFLAYYMLFSDGFLAGPDLKINNEVLPFLNHSGIQCFELEEQTAGEIELLIFKINEEITKKEPAAGAMVRHLIRIILIYAYRGYHPGPGASELKNNPSRHLFNRYIKLVNANFLSIRRVSDYAAMLHVSADHLNRAIKSSSGKTAHELVNDMINMEAKAMLLHTGMSISEIAYTLKFTDPSHFNRFFRTKNGYSPLQYRKES